MPERFKIDGGQGYDGRAVANLILDWFDPHVHQISNLKLNKLLFFAHGFFGARFEAKLIRNHIEAWDNGPVVRVVFDSFKGNGRRPIENRAHVYDYILQENVIINITDMNRVELEYINKVVSYYVKYSANDLVDLTHRSGTPWYRARNEPSRLLDRIPDEWIRDFFVDNFGGAAAN